MNSSYRVLKLQSGEEIIAKIKGREKDKVVLENPMVIKTTIKTNVFGNSQEVVFLKDWLSNTPSNIIKIPETFIISWLIPSKDVSRLYSLERNNRKQCFPNNNSPIPNKDILNKLLEELQNLDENKTQNPWPFPHHHPKEMNDNFVFMHMMLPPDVIKEMFEEGLLEFDGFEEENELSEEINEHKYTGNETNDPEYGNRWTDWNPDPFNEEYS